MKLVILGIQGSGKGTQSELLAKKFTLKHISAGDVLRKEIQNKTNYGKQIKDYVDNGLLVPPKLTNEIMAANIPKNNYLLDGYPRDLVQAEFIDQVNAPEKVIFLELPKKEVYHRLGSRVQCSKCGMIFGLNNLKNTVDKCKKCGGELVKRKDDNDQAIAVRIEEFKKETLPLVKFYKTRIIKINANQSVDKVFSDIRKALK